MIENDAFAFSLPPSGADYLPSYPLPEKISEEQVQPQSASRTLFCLICSCLMKSPISLPCGHTFCCKCLRSWMNVKLECPTCRGQIPSITLRKNITINDMIQEVPLKCPANLQCEKLTCKAHITVRDLADHTNKCPHILLTCKCKILIPRGSFLESEQKCECPEITCKYCLNKFQERLIRFHSDSCQNEQMKCSLCHTTMLRKDWIRHESKECFAPCPYVKYGCKSDKLSPIKLKEHITEELSNHKLLLVQFIQPELAQKVDRLSKELETHKFTPPKYIIKKLKFEFEGRTLKSKEPLNCTIKKVVEEIFRSFCPDEEGECNLSVRRKKTMSKLDPNLSFIDYDIQENEVISIEKLESA